MPRILVAPHHFEIGGSQLTALELAAEVARDAAHEVVLYAPDGALAERARATGLELHLSNLRESAPSPGRIRELAALVERRGIDLVHAYEWAPAVDAAYGARALRGTPVLATILSMDYPGFLPGAVPLILGTSALRERAIGEGRAAHLLEPSVDTRLFDAAAVPDAAVCAARGEAGAAPGDVLITVIGRLAEQLKLEGLLTLIEACGRLADAHQVRLAIVGDGSARARVAAAAQAANREAGREIVRLLGSRDDPRPHYLAADIAVGMGSSALRAMALGRPLLVQGERGFWRVADSTSLPGFLARGWFGEDAGSAAAADRCASELARLIRMSPSERAGLGAWGRDLVVGRYGLTRAADVLRGLYADVLAAPRPSKRQRIAASVGLARDIAAHRVAMRHPALQASFRRATGRSTAAVA